MRFPFCLLAATLAVGIARADGPADNRVTDVRPVPPLGNALPGRVAGSDLVPLPPEPTAEVRRVQVPVETQRRGWFRLRAEWIP